MTWMSETDVIRASHYDSHVVRSTAPGAGRSDPVCEKPRTAARGSWCTYRGP